MNTIFTHFMQNRLRMCGLAAACVMAATSLTAQKPVARISSEINVAEQTPLKGSLHPLAQAQNDAGRMPGDTRLTGVTLYFNRSAAQEADLQALIVAQQNPASPSYHQWLTPDQFATRFGMAQSDIAQVQGWLERQGFAVDAVNRSHNAIHFSGTVNQVEQAFATQMHYYQVNGNKHFAPSTALSLPTAIASTVVAVRNLDDFRPKPMHIRGSAVQARPGFTYYNGTTQDVLIAPGDLKVIYDFPATGTGETGTGQTIAIMGQSAVTVSDIEAFQNASGLTVKDPTLVLVPGTGTSTREADGDEGESDLDLEWSGATAPGANIIFVYTGSNNAYGAFDSVAYAIDEKIDDGLPRSGKVLASGNDSNDGDCFGAGGNADIWPVSDPTGAILGHADEGPAGATSNYCVTNATTPQYNVANTSRVDNTATGISSLCTLTVDTNF